MLNQLGKNVHIIGIGGARLSALAKLLAARGYRVTGSDSSESSFIRRLRSQGIPVQIGHDAAHIGRGEWVIYTTAVSPENPELVAAKERGLPVFEGAEVLGLFMEGAKNAIAISGTHGKTTTTAMTALALVEAGVDPTIVIGGEVDELGGNARPGGVNYFLTEACEFREAFLHLKPNLAVVTNIDWDHPDCFPTLDSVVATFRKFLALLPQDGHLVVCGDDPNAAALAVDVPGSVWNYGLEADNRVRALDLEPIEPLGQRYHLEIDGEPGGVVELAIPGRHNVLNSLACITVCRVLGLPISKVVEPLKTFRGVHRRFEVKGQGGGVVVVDDYAHHPSAIRTTLRTAREHFRGRIWCVFQPHLYSRTRHLMSDFAQSFGDADNVVFTDIYAAREADPGDVSSAILSEETRKHHGNVRFMGSLSDVASSLPPLLRPGDLVITMGAGDITNLGERLLKILNG